MTLRKIGEKSQPFVRTFPPGSAYGWDARNDLIWLSLSVPVAAYFSEMCRKGKIVLGKMSECGTSLAFKENT
jgi:hypothetical protein